MWYLNLNSLLYLSTVYYFFDFIYIFNFFYSLESTLTLWAQSLLHSSINLKLLCIITLFLITYFFIIWPALTIFLYFNFYLNIAFFELNHSIQLTPQLHNGCMIVHPVLLYLFIALNIIIFIFLVASFILRGIFLFNLYLLKQVFFIGFFSVFLGCFWAYQELNWGGWWGWDLIELSSLIFLILLLQLLHIKFTTFVNKYILILYFMYGALFLFFWIGSRYDFFSSVHSFISQQNNLNLSKKFYFLFLFLFLPTSIFFKKYNIIQFFFCSLNLIYFTIFSYVLLTTFFNFIDFTNFFTILINDVFYFLFFKIKILFIHITFFEFFFFVFYFYLMLNFRQFFYLHFILFSSLLTIIYTNLTFSVITLNLNLLFQYYFSTSHFFLYTNSYWVAILNNNFFMYTDLATFQLTLNFKKDLLNFFLNKSIYFFNIYQVYFFNFHCLNMSNFLIVSFDFFILIFFCMLLVFKKILFKKVKLAF